MKTILVSGTLAAKNDGSYKPSIVFSLPMVEEKANRELYKIAEVIEKATGLFVVDIYFHTIEAN